MSNRLTRKEKRLIRKWIRALKSGDFRQGFGKLRKGNTYCCLGVLCEIHPRIQRSMRGYSLKGVRLIPVETYRIFRLHPLKTLLEKLLDRRPGIYHLPEDVDPSNYFIRLNDSTRTTFPEIAEKIEELLEKAEKENSWITRIQKRWGI